MGGEVFFDQDSSNQDSSDQDSSVQCFGMSRAMLIDVEDVEEVGEGRKKEGRGFWRALSTRFFFLRRSYHLHCTGSGKNDPMDRYDSCERDIWAREAAQTFQGKGYCVPGPVFLGDAAKKG
jgi:hypothetical protein